MFGDFSELRNAPTAIPPYPVHVCWDEAAAVTPFGQLVYSKPDALTMFLNKPWCDRLRPTLSSLVWMATAWSAEAHARKSSSVLDFC